MMLHTCTAANNRRDQGSDSSIRSNSLFTLLNSEDDLLNSIQSNKQSSRKHVADSEANTWEQETSNKQTQMRDVLDKQISTKDGQPPPTQTNDDSIKTLHNVSKEWEPLLSDGDPYFFRVEARTHRLLTRPERPSSPMLIYTPEKWNKSYMRLQLTVGNNTPEPDPESETEPQPQFEPEPLPELKPEPEPKFEPEPVPQFEPEPEAELEPEPVVTPELELKLKRNPEPRFNVVQELEERRRKLLVSTGAKPQNIWYFTKKEKLTETNNVGKTCIDSRPRPNESNARKDQFIKSPAVSLESTISSAISRLLKHKPQSAFQSEPYPALETEYQPQYKPEPAPTLEAEPKLEPIDMRYNEVEEELYIRRKRICVTPVFESQNVWYFARKERIQEESIVTSKSVLECPGRLSKGIHDTVIPNNCPRTVSKARQGDCMVLPPAGLECKIADAVSRLLDHKTQSSCEPESDANFKTRLDLQHGRELNNRPEI